MRGAGLSIESLIEYVSLFQQGIDTVALRKELLLEQRRQLFEKIEKLQNTLSYLDTKIDGYEERMIKVEGELKKFEE
jgi:DNA-binding transcriptional MerR regulator